jgi:hypothetical protein
MRDRRMDPTKAPLAASRGKSSRTETEKRRSKPRKCRNIFKRAEMAHRDGTGWLGPQLSANPSPRQIPC